MRWEHIYCTAYSLRYGVPSSERRPTVMYPLKGQIGGIESPFSIKLHCLGVRKFICKARASRPRGKKRRWLESHHGPREEAQCARVHLEPLQNICGVEEPHHSNPVKESDFVMMRLLICIMNTYNIIRTALKIIVLIDLNRLSLRFSDSSLCWELLTQPETEHSTWTWKRKSRLAWWRRPQSRCHCHKSEG